MMSKLATIPQALSRGFSITMAHPAMSQTRESKSNAHVETHEATLIARVKSDESEVRMKITAIAAK